MNRDASNGSIYPGRRADHGSNVNDDVGLQERRQARTEDGKRLEATLSAINRLNLADRRTIVRNFGRLVERSFKGEERAAAGRIFRKAHGERYGQSLEKKRKRYLRFEGEPLPIDAGHGEYAAKGMEFIRLLRAYSELKAGSSGVSDTEWSGAIIELCQGASFATSSGPFLAHSREARQAFQDAIEKMLDRIAKETDIVRYLDDITRWNLNFKPNNRDDYTAADLNSLHLRLCQLQSIQHQTGADSSLSSLLGHDRVRLEGCDVKDEDVSFLLPRIRMGRLYLPRRVLCLSACVKEAELDEIRNAVATPQRLKEARALFEADNGDNPYRFADETGRSRDDVAMKYWKECREKELRDAAILGSGFNPHSIDWADLEDQLEFDGFKGVSWLTFWQARSLDLILTAQDRPEALRLGLKTGGDWWSYAPKDLRHPRDDDSVGKEIDNCTFTDEEGMVYAWMPDGRGGLLVCRGLVQATAITEPLIAFDSTEHPLVEKLHSKNILSIYDDISWDAFNQAMTPWQSADSAARRTAKPAFRPLFDCPDGWTPASDDTIAAAMLRSLAYGSGVERLDSKLMEAINVRVSCLSRMKEDAHRLFEKRLMAD